MGGKRMRRPETERRDTRFWSNPSNKYTAERRARQAWRSDAGGYRPFDEARAEAERMRRGGWCFALAWGLAVAAMVTLMALFGIGC